MNRAAAPQGDLFDDLPYGEIIDDMLAAIFSALAILSSSRHIGDEQISEINKQFGFLRGAVKPGKNRHLLTRFPGLASLRGFKKGRTEFTRVSAVLFHWFRKVNDMNRWRISNENVASRERDAPAAFLPSPLAILFDLLTDPDDASTRAYALVAVRNVLLREFHLVPSGYGPCPKDWTIITPEAVADSLSRVETFRIGRDNFPASGSGPMAAFINHYLAMRGMVHFRFGTDTARKSINGITHRLNYCKGSTLISDQYPYEFRIDPELTRLPSAAELVNEIWGVPIPIRGAETVFFGGMKFSESGGLVVGVSGGPGTGKTSFALSLIAKLAPLKAGALFVTAEESPDDIYGRLASLLPDRIRRLSFAPSYDRTDPQMANWFAVRPCRRPGMDSIPLGPETLKEFIDDLARLYDATTRSKVIRAVPHAHPCRLVLVLDSLHSFFPDEPNNQEISTYTLEQFVADCRALGALVVLTFSSNWHQSRRLEYLIDTAIDLQYQQTQDRGLKPSRLFILSKTRQQISRPGAHGFHISGEEGFRIAPQIPSQLDRKALFRSVLPSTEQYIETFLRKTPIEAAISLPAGVINRKLSYRPKDADHLQIARCSHLVIYGKWSSGKAGLALKLAIAPLISLKGKRQISMDSSVEIQKVLVISFLYPKEYYAKLLSALFNLSSVEYGRYWSGRIDRPTMEVLYFYPGYLQPEDLYERVVQELERAELTGQPYTSVVVDGVHNVFLQFPAIQEYGMIWPALMSMFKRKNITVVSTHTLILIESAIKDEESVAVQDSRALPMLQFLVQGADYVIALDRVKDAISELSLSDEQASQLGAVMRVRVVSAIQQQIPLSQLYWSREKLVLFDDASDQLSFL